MRRYHNKSYQSCVCEHKTEESVVCKGGMVWCAREAWCKRHPCYVGIMVNSLHACLCFVWRTRSHEGAWVGACVHASTDAHEKRGQQFVTREDFCGQGGLPFIQGCRAWLIRSSRDTRGVNTCAGWLLCCRKLCAKTFGTSLGKQGAVCEYGSKSPRGQRCFSREKINTGRVPLVPDAQERARTKKYTAR